MQVDVVMQQVMMLTFTPRYKTKLSMSKLVEDYLGNLVYIRDKFEEFLKAVEIEDQ